MGLQYGNIIYSEAQSKFQKNKFDDLRSTISKIITIITTCGYKE